MKYENAAITFIIVMLADLFLYWFARESANNFFNTFGKLLFMAVVVLALLRFLMTSIQFQKQTSSLFYFGLLVITLLLMLAQLIASAAVVPVIDYFFIFAVMIAVFLAIIELGRHFYDLHLIIRKEQDARMRAEKAFNRQISAEERARKRLLGEQANLLAQNKKYRSYLQRRQENITELSREAATAKTELRKAQRNIKEMGRQEELKKKYAKSLYNLRRKIHEEEELLVVSPDGKSVHDPGCIVVRNIKKENRKLIKNWATAKKEGYKGCGMCNPHKKDKALIRNGRKYRFVGSKVSDKLHKVSCNVVERIPPKDRELFTSYKKGLAKGYTACRVCNPGQ
ncbi:MAG: hypothetical protein GXP63_00830 [DPANN group archaeon]|nr:hypothetical protein [DPANN group archaeon]